MYCGILFSLMLSGLIIAVISAYFWYSRTKSGERSYRKTLEASLSETRMLTDKVLELQAEIRELKSSAGV